MKKVCVSLFSTAFLVVAVTLIAGCGSGDPVTPPDQIPDVPPSTRSGGGALPGQSGKNKKKKTSYNYKISSQEMIG